MKNTLNPQDSQVHRFESFDPKEIILRIPHGYSEIRYKGKKYSLTRTDFNSGKSLKVFARELGGNDFVSFNYYLTQDKELLKACEMPDQKVLDFLSGMRTIEE